MTRGMERRRQRGSTGQSTSLIITFINLTSPLLQWPVALDGLAYTTPFYEWDHACLSLVVWPPICKRNVKKFDLGESLKTFLFIFVFLSVFKKNLKYLYLFPSFKVIFFYF